MCMKQPGDCFYECLIIKHILTSSNAWTRLIGELSLSQILFSYMWNTR